MKKLAIIVALVAALALPAAALAVSGSKFLVVVNHGCSDRRVGSTAVIRCGAGHATTVGVRTRDTHIRYRGTTLHRGQVWRYGGLLLVTVAQGQHITILYTF